MITHTQNNTTGQFYDKLFELLSKSRNGFILIHSYFLTNFTFGFEIRIWQNKIHFLSFLIMTYFYGSWSLNPMT